MKKTYMIPEVTVVPMEVHQMICGSINTDGDNLSVGISSEDTGSFDDNTINARGGNFWSDEDY